MRREREGGGSDNVCTKGLPVGRGYPESLPGHVLDQFAVGAGGLNDLQLGQVLVVEANQHLARIRHHIKTSNSSRGLHILPGNGRRSSIGRSQPAGSEEKAGGRGGGSAHAGAGEQGESSPHHLGIHKKQKQIDLLLFVKIQKIISLIHVLRGLVHRLRKDRNR
jgi:hypothetical protein